MHEFWDIYGDVYSWDSARVRRGVTKLRALGAEQLAQAEMLELLAQRRDRHQGDPGGCRRADRPRTCGRRSPQTARRPSFNDRLVMAMLNKRFTGRKASFIHRAFIAARGVR